MDPKLTLDYANDRMREMQRTVAQERLAARCRQPTSSRGLQPLLRLVDRDARPDLSAA